MNLEHIFAFEPRAYSVNETKQLYKSIIYIYIYAYILRLTYIIGRRVSQ